MKIPCVGGGREAPPPQITHSSRTRVLKFSPTSSVPASPCKEKGHPGLATWNRYVSEMCMWSWRTVRVPWWAPPHTGRSDHGFSGNPRPSSGSSPLWSNTSSSCSCHSSPNKVLQQSWDPSLKVLMRYSWLLVIIAIIAHKAVFDSHRITPITIMTSG